MALKKRTFLDRQGEKPIASTPAEACRALRGGTARWTFPSACRGKGPRLTSAAIQNSSFKLDFVQEQLYLRCFLNVDFLEVRKTRKF